MSAYTLSFAGIEIPLVTLDVNTAAAITAAAAAAGSAGDAAADASSAATSAAAAATSAAAAAATAGSWRASVQASEAIGAGKFVNVYDLGGATRVRLADASIPARFANGFVVDAIANGASGMVTFVGINGAVAPGAPASEVWLSAVTPGGYETAPPATAGHIVQALGPALPGVGIAFHPQPRIEL